MKYQGITKVITIQAEGETMIVQKFTENEPVVWETFLIKTKKCIPQGITKVMRIHPLDTMDICTKSYGNPCISC